MYETERVLRTGVVAMTTGDMETLPTCFADDVAVHVPGTNQLSGDYKGKGELFDGFLGKLMTLTDGQVVLEPHDILGSEHHAAGIYTWRATRDGRTFEWRQVNVYHVTNGQIVELWQHPFDFEAWNEFWS
jgi:ketosteroid isomerase-like protein